MNNLFLMLNECLSEECYNEILSIIGDILFESVAAPEAPKAPAQEAPKAPEKDDDDLSNPRKQADFWAEKHKYYTEGDGRKHEYARQLAMYARHLSKTYQKEAEKAGAANPV